MICLPLPRSMAEASQPGQAEWSAKWIAPPDGADSNAWLSYRKTFTAGDEVPDTARIACDSKYWLWVNDELAVFEGQLKRGPTPTGTYYDEVDLSAHLRPNETNTVAVLVWYFGKHGFSHKSSGRAGLVFDAGPGAPLNSDDTWKVLRHPAFGSTGSPHPNYRLPEHNTRFDARQDIGRWQASDFDDSAWSQAQSHGSPPTGPWGELWERPIPHWRTSDLQPYENDATLPDVSAGGVIKGKLPYNAQVTPYLKIDAPAGLKIDVRTDNYNGGSAPNLRAEYITREGVQEWELPTWINGHEMWYEIPAGVEVLDLKYRETGYNADMVGRFTSDDEHLNTLWRKARRTLHVTMRDTYMDCPDRERAQWWGDAVNELGEAFYVYDAQRGPLLAKKGIAELCNWQRSDDTFYSPVPSGNWNKELPRQMLASAGWYGFWTYYRYSGDRDTIEMAYPHVKRYLDVWELGGDGLIKHRTGEWDWTDWGSNKDVAVIENSWMYLALKAAVEMAALTDNEDDIPTYRTQMESIEQNFNAAFWRGDHYRSSGYDGATDDRANAMAVIAGLAEAEYYDAIRDVLSTQRHASPFMEKYVLESLYLMGFPEEALARMKQRYEAQIDSDLTTLWEGWGLGGAGYGGGTYNHAWSGGPLTILSQFAAGVEPDEAGWASFSVLPQMGGLRHIESRVPTPYGNIDLELLCEDEAFLLDLLVPAGTTATVGIPLEELLSRSLLANGELIWADGEFLGDLDGLTAAGSDQRWLKFDVDSGQWDFRAIPEPTSCVTLGFAALGLLGRRHRNSVRKSSQCIA